MLRMKKSVVVVCAGIAALALAACGGSASTSESTSAAPESSSAAPGVPWSTSDCTQIVPPTTTDAPPEGSVVEGEVSTTADVAIAPTVAVLQGAVPATSLVTADVVPGSGDEVAAGATVTVQYCGVGLASGAVFDSSWARGEPVSFPLSGVIQGWQDGIPGMKPGGRRILIIPGAAAYGPQPPPGSGIQPDETLIFVVDMISSP
jgi:peptidylprolyl isomerase